MDNFNPTVPQVVPGYGVGSVPDATSTPDDAVAHRIYMENPSSHGKLCAVLMPAYEPTTDLLWTAPPTDDPSTPNVDESTLMPKETWPKDRPYLVNMGGNRISLLGQDVRFDCSFSQGDEDAIVTDASWDFGDGGTATGLVVHHTYNAPGTYTVTCATKGQTGTRHIRVLSELGESDWDITALNSLSASADTGWQASLLVQGGTENIDPFQGVLLYIYDDTDVSWREDYENSFRALARKTAYTSDPAPDPIWDITTINSGYQNSAGGSSSGGSTAGIGSPSGDTWANINRYNDLIASACNAQGVPPNLAKAVIYLESGGDPSNATATGNSSCPYAYGLFQIACGCAAVTCPGNYSDMFDPATNIALGAQHLAINYRECGNSWDGAICAYFAGHCNPDGASDILGTSDYDYINIVRQHWAEADAATPAAGGGSTDPIYGEVVFDGYVTDIQTHDHNNGTDMTVDIEGSALILQKLSQRREVFFETSGAYGGTIMSGPPMRIATCIHHLLKVHTDFPDTHDVILDWSGPRMTSTTANEGAMWSNIKAWADNDFATAWTDRHGRFRYEPRPHYRGKAWFDQAIQNAVLIDPRLIITADVTERTMDARTTWVKLCGLLSNGSCEICGEYPCGGPVGGNAGQWKVQRGFQYDDYRTLCALSAHHYAYLNRRYDISFQMAWRHDIEIHDLIQMPLKDASGKYDWSNGNAPVFVVTSIAHQYNTTGTWLTTITAEELTYGVACDCPQPHCPKTVECATCNSSQNSQGPGGGILSGCTNSGLTNASNWGVATISHSLAESDGFWSYNAFLPNCADCDVFHSVQDNGFEDYRTSDTALCRHSDSPYDGIAHDVSTSGAGIVGQLTATYSLSDVSQTGATTGSQTSRTESVSWVDFVALGPVGTSMMLKINLDLDASSVGSGLLYLYALDSPSSADVQLVSDDEASFAQFSYPSKLIGSVSGSTTLGLVEGSGNGSLEPPTSVQNDSSLTVLVPCSPAGSHYRIGLMADKSDTSRSTQTFLQCMNYYLVQHEFYHQWVVGADVGAIFTIITDKQIYTGTDRPLTVFNNDWDSGYHHSFLGPGGVLTFDTLTDTSSSHQTQHGTYTPIQAYSVTEQTEGADTSLLLRVTFENSGCVQSGLQYAQQGSYGSYSYPMYNGGAIAGTCGNWPTNLAINTRISASEQANQRSSPLHMTGDLFIQHAQNHGINPGVVVAIMQRESQLGADGTTLPTTFNNFGGVSGSGTCDSGQANGRDWAKYCTAEDGIEGVFSTLDGPLYRATGGALADVMNIYSPASDNNNVSDMWQIFGAVASDLKITLNSSTQVYSTEECTTPAGVLIAGPPAGQPGFGGCTTMLEYVMHQSNMIISQGPWGPWSHQNCDCYDMAVVIGTPVYPLIAGTVILAGPTADVYEPNTIVIRTAYGDIRYGHLSAVNVIAGQSVALDTLLGYSGSAGTGPHLHLGLEGSVGGSPKGLNLTQTMQSIGFNIGSFPWEG